MERYGRPSVRPSVCLSRCSRGGAVSTQPGADSRAAVARGRIVLNASRIQTDDVRVSLFKNTALCSKCGQCNVHSQGTRLNTRICGFYVCCQLRWLGSRVVSVLDSGAEGPGFKSQPRRCRVTVLGKLFTPIVPLFTKQRNW